MTDKAKQDNGAQPGPGEQIRPREAQDDHALDNLRGGADPSGGQSSEVPRDNSKAGPHAGENGRKSRDITPLSTPGEGRAGQRPTEEDLAQQNDGRTAHQGGDQ